MHSFTNCIVGMICSACALSACAQESSGDAEASSGTTIVVETTGALTSAQRSQLIQSGIEVSDFLGDGRYLAYVGPGSEVNHLSRDFNSSMELRSFESQRKVADEFRHGNFPEYAQVGSKVRVVVDLFDAHGIDHAQVLSRYGEEVHQEMNTRRWALIIDPATVQRLSEEGVVKHIAVMEDPDLLDADQFQ